MESGRKRDKCSPICICSKGALVILAIALTGFCSYAYISWFLIPYLFVGLPNSSSQSQLKSYGLILLFVHATFIMMIMWSLFKTWQSNPGYVTDYFKSVLASETKDSEKITNLPTSNEGCSNPGSAVMD
jgi:hypothetical protein